MIRVAVCDDNKKYLEELYGYITEYFRDVSDMESRISCFHSGTELLKVLKDQKFDAYFLDVLMPGLNGMELGRSIRAEDEQAVLVYITVSREFAFEAFGVRAFRYLEKPVEKSALYESLDRIVDEVRKRQNSEICIRTRTGLVKVKAADIMYVENIARCAAYMLKTGEQINSICNRGSFEESVGFLSEHPAFVQPHKSYFVNMHFIRNLGPRNMILDDGTQIAVSRNRFSHTKKVYLKYLSDEGVL